MFFEVATSHLRAITGSAINFYKDKAVLFGW